MKGGKIAATTALLLLLLAFGAEAELCTQISKTFKGWCHYDMNCAAVCVTEGCTGGFCEGVFPSVCKCTKDCGGGGEDSPPGAGGPPAELTARARRAGGHV